MKKTQNHKSPRQSLRTMLMLWLLVFAIVPLAFITGYSLVKYEQAIDQELSQRLIGNKREVQVIFRDFYSELERRNRSHASDKELIYYLTTNAIGSARTTVLNWMKSGISQHTSVFNRDGRLEIALSRDGTNNISRQKNLEGGDVYLSEKFIEQTKTNAQLSILDFTGDGALDLILFSRIETAKGVTIGYLEEILHIDSGFIENMKNRLNLELVFVSANGEKVVSSHDDLKRYRQGFFIEKYKEVEGGIFDLNIRGVPYGVMVQPLTWGTEQFFVVVAASKQAAVDVLRNVNHAFFVVVGIVVLLLVFLSFIFSRIMLQPLSTLLASVQSVDFEKEPVPVKAGSENEIGILTESFNDMVRRVYEAQRKLKENIKKLEEANNEIRDTQAKLVHTAKMASLGQLVAGIAHELNNPISFIYSNMTYLKEYGEKLIRLVDVASKEPNKLPDEKEKLEFDYIVGDMPKLIKSCEEGAKRTRDIILGLRSFSRLEEAKLKDVDIHEGIESTLSLLSGEIKSRITIKKNFGELGLVSCYPSELNQVFMNIFTNAIHAISGTGEIEITTKKISGNKIEISIRDSGSGMSEEVRDKLFDPFFTTKDGQRGTGLGMSITYGIIKKHFGDITVQSEPRKGTEFKITLPIHQK